MRPSLVPQLVWSLLVVVAFASGFFIGDDLSNAGAHPSQRLKTESGTGAPDPSTAESRSATDSSTGARIAKLSPEQARTVTFELLGEPNRIKRLSRLCELLDRVTPENWREVMDAFVRQTAFEGREHDAEWKLMLHRVGEVGGVDGVVAALNENGAGREHRARHLFEGWV
ncbi:MAG TPA: hypothetical protein VFG14_19175, partial [Chthoniobacteraceae bacterium]|nr:hypothetical protein [Chthoniobacteraceae bacterium]